MSGSALADAAGPGRIGIQMMVKAGYRPGFAGALGAAAAIIGPIIPPSIPMVLYGVVSNTSIGYLFLAGVIPGLLLAAGQMALIAVVAKRQELPVGTRTSRAEAISTTKSAGPTLLLPVILLGGIYGGAVTPTEAAAVAAAYALLLAAFWYRSLDIKTLLAVFTESSRSTAIVAITIAGALVMNWIVASEQVPEAMGSWIVSMHMSPAMFLLAVNILFLILGCLVDTLLMLLVIVPILMPTVHALGIDPVHFGVTAIINMMIGLITPPMGQLVFLISGITGITVSAITREVWIFLAVLIGVLFLLVYVPQLTLWLPIQMGYQPVTGPMQ
jgi:tripartite ATP-independent transporter DctM subunit